MKVVRIVQCICKSRIVAFGSYYYYYYFDEFICLLLRLVSNIILQRNEKKIDNREHTT